MNTLQQVEDALTIERMLARATLDERHLDVLNKRFYDDMTLREIAQEFGLSQERIRQMEAKALRRIRERNKIVTGLPPLIPQIPQTKITPQKPDGTFKPGNCALTCDGCAHPFVTGMWHDGGSIAERKIAHVRDMARKAGWQTDEEGDYCAACCSKMKEHT